MAFWPARANPRCSSRLLSPRLAPRPRFRGQSANTRAGGSCPGEGVSTLPTPSNRTPAAPASDLSDQGGAGTLLLATGQLRRPGTDEPASCVRRSGLAGPGPRGTWGPSTLSATLLSNGSHPQPGGSQKSKREPRRSGVKGDGKGCESGPPSASSNVQSHPSHWHGEGVRPINVDVLSGQHTLTSRRPLMPDHPSAPARPGHQPGPGRCPRYPQYQRGP